MVDDGVFGRGPERGRIDRVLVAAGTSSYLVVCGEAGIGKTALMDYAARRARGGMRVLMARGTESEWALACSASAELVGPVLEGLSVLPARARVAGLLDAHIRHGEPAGG